MSNKPIHVLLVETFNRAYRVPLLRRLSEHPDIDLTLVHGTSQPTLPAEVGITIAAGPMPFRTISGPITGIRWRHREVLWFSRALKTLERRSFDVVISDYYTRLLSIWPMQSLQRRRNQGFILWGIGFHQYRTPLIDKIRILMVKRTDALLLYSERERKRYVEMGVPSDKLFVAQNTIDLEGIDAGIASATDERLRECRRLTDAIDAPLLLHVGRLAPNKRLDLLLRVLPVLQRWQPKIKLVLIGEGPEREALENLAHALRVREAVYFAGPIIDHVDLAPWVLTSDLVVAPAQIGLLAPMAHAYGKALVTSDNQAMYGPEVQAFVPSQTGGIYRFEDIDDLAHVITDLLDDPEKRRRLGEAGSARVRELMSPELMVQGFLDAIRYICEKKSLYSKRSI